MPIADAGKFVTELEKTIEALRNAVCDQLLGPRQRSLSSPAEAASGTANVAEESPEECSGTGSRQGLEWGYNEGFFST
jgi:hypothetical protein